MGALLNEGCFSVKMGDFAVRAFLRTFAVFAVFVVFLPHPRYTQRSGSVEGAMAPCLVSSSRYLATAARPFSPVSNTMCSVR